MHAATKAGLLMLTTTLAIAGWDYWRKPPSVAAQPAVPVASLSGTAAQAQARPAPAWVVAPDDYGDDIPPAGRSLFDEHVEAVGGAEALPFPFERLLQVLDGDARCPDLPEGRCLVRVLIPLGRSLQRLAAAPDFFRDPRIVAAMAGEPERPIPTDAGGRFAGGFGDAVPAIPDDPGTAVASAVLGLRMLPGVAGAGANATGVPSAGDPAHGTDRPPAPNTAPPHRPAPGALQRDRLYLGHVRGSGLIEVISYNETAARFEFQLVHGYRPGGTPRVVYAPRPLCLSCHQNHGPIFSRPLWLETNANPAVAERLVAHAESFDGVPARRGIDLPAAIDEATDRANLFALWQTLWRTGCGTGEAGVRCRAALFEATLQYRANRGHGYDPALRAPIRTAFADAWRRHWPGGLAVPDPDIPNRDPLLADGLMPAIVPAPATGLRSPPRLPGSGVATGAPVQVRPSERDDRAGGSHARAAMLLANIPSPFEPLVPRAPLEIWRQADDAKIDAVVAGLAGFLGDDDLARVEAVLVRQRSARREIRLDCAPIAAPPAKRLDLRCGDAKQGQLTAVLTLAAAPSAMEPTITGGSAALSLPGERVLGDLRLTPPDAGREPPPIRASTEVPADAAEVPSAAAPPAEPAAAVRRRASDAGSTEDLRLRDAPGPPAAPPRVATFDVTRGSGGARTRSGHAIEQVRIRRPTSADAGEVVIVVREDFAPVSRAIASLATLPHGAALAPGPFRRAPMMAALLAELGAPIAAAAGAASSGLHPTVPVSAPTSPPAADTPQFPPARVAGSFQRFCTPCHRTPSSSPPNFLHGNEATVEARLTHCAARIRYRLAMWQLPPAARPKTPMPPVQALGRLGADPDAWSESRELAALAAYAAKLDGGAPLPEPDNYESLPPCLPASG